MKNITLTWIGGEHCPGCHTGRPTVVKFCHERGIAMNDLDVDDDCGKVGSLGVSSLPTAIVYRNGQEIGRWEGAYPGPRVAKLIEDIVNR